MRTKNSVYPESHKGTSPFNVPPSFKFNFLHERTDGRPTGRRTTPWAETIKKLKGSMSTVVYGMVCVAACPIGMRVDLNLV